MNKPAIDRAFVDLERALYVRMERDYTTVTFNLGERTYVTDHIYRVDEHMLAEILRQGVGQQLTKEHAVRDPLTGVIPHYIAYQVIRPTVPIVSKVTRWFTSNGRDTHYLTAEKISRVPSNLAAWLLEAGYATAA